MTKIKTNTQYFCMERLRHFVLCFFQVPKIKIIPPIKAMQKLQRDWWIRFKYRINNSWGRVKINLKWDKKFHILVKYFKLLIIDLRHFLKIYCGKFAICFIFYLHFEVEEEKCFFTPRNEWYSSFFFLRNL